MSELCLVNVKDHNLEFKTLNEFAKKLIKLALKKDIAVFFNSYDYSLDLIKEANMKDFFIMSDSFLYKNCEFLNSTCFAYLWGTHSIKAEFFKKYEFFNDFLKTIFDYDINTIEIFITEDGSANCLEDFEEVVSSSENFLSDLYESVLSHVDTCAYTFPSIKFVINRNC